MHKEAKKDEKPFFFKLKDKYFDSGIISFEFLLENQDSVLYFSLFIES